jgi:hypothetical protein
MVAWQLLRPQQPRIRRYYLGHGAPAEHYRDSPKEFSRSWTSILSLCFRCHLGLGGVLGSATLFGIDSFGGAMSSTSYSGESGRKRVTTLVSQTTSTRCCALYSSQIHRRRLWGMVTMRESVRHQARNRAREMSPAALRHQRW